MVPSPCNILIAIISGGTVRAELVPCLIAAIEVLKGHGAGVNISMHIGGYAAHNRNEAVKLAQQHKSDYLMFIDNDMQFPASGIQRLLDADKDIIGVHYNARPRPGGQVVSTVKLKDPTIEPHYGQVVSTVMPAQLFTCYSVGTGFTLIRTSIFDKLQKPYFISGQTDDEEPFTEDVYFCGQAHKAGIEIWCNPTIPMKHTGTQEF